MDSYPHAIDSLPERFDDELDVHILINNLGAKRIESLLDKILGGHYRLLDTRGNTLMGHTIAGPTHARHIEIDFDHLMTLETRHTDGNAADLAEEMLKLLAHNAIRYLMTARLHIDSINEDFRRLEEKNAQLELSESRYRELCETLEEKVQAQVQTIDQARRQLYHAEKMASIGQLAAGIAHEINTPLCYMQGNISVALEYADIIGQLQSVFATRSLSALEHFWEEQEIDFLLKDLTNALTDCQTGIDKTAGIIANLKDFSNVDREERLTKPIEEIVRSTCNIFASSIGDSIALHLATQPTAPIDCCPGFVGQALLNILMNAAQAMGEQQANGNPNGRIEVTTGEDARFVYVRIEDTGPGIPPAVLEKVCDPFFTTREVGSGTGLGLTVAYDVAKNHNGYLDIANKADGGAAVTLYLGK